MDVSSIPACWEVTQEFHAQRIQDVLQIRSTLWYAWKSLSTQLEALAPQTTLAGTKNSRKQHHNFMRKHAAFAENQMETRKRKRFAESKNKANYEDHYKYTCPHAMCHEMRRFNEMAFKQHV